MHTPTSKRRELEMPFDVIAMQELARQRNADLQREVQHRSQRARRTRNQ